MFKWMLVFTLLLPTICFADTDDYVHADFYRGLVGLKKQVDEINRDLRLLENATLSNAEVNRRLARIEQDIDAVKTLYNEATRNLRQHSININSHPSCRYFCGYCLDEPTLLLIYKC